MLHTQIDLLKIHTKCRSQKAMYHNMPEKICKYILLYAFSIFLQKLITQTSDNVNKQRFTINQEMPSQQRILVAAGIKKLVTISQAQLVWTFHKNMAALQSKIITMYFYNRDLTTGLVHPQPDQRHVLIRISQEITTTLPNPQQTRNSRSSSSSQLNKTTKT